jgi:hypothetical protein
MARQVSFSNPVKTGDFREMKKSWKRGRSLSFRRVFTATCIPASLRFT